MISEIMQDLGYRVRTCVGKTGVVAETMGGTHEIRFQDGYPPTSNNLDMVELIKGVASKIIGPQNIAKPPPEMGSEDFGYFVQDIPGAMFILGCRIEGDPRRHHDPRFDIDESCMPIGAAILAESVITYMNQFTKD
jgi:amidohydrolase